MNSQPGPTPADPIAGGSAGRALRQAREAAGMHIGTLAVSLKVPVKRLEALEADDLAQLPDAVFARALAATVCRTLKIDPAPILLMLPQLQTPPLQVGSLIGSPRIDVPLGMAGVPGLSSVPKPVLYTTAALLMAALLVWVLPLLNLGISGSGANSDAEVVRSLPGGSGISTDPAVAAPVQPEAAPVPAPAVPAQAPAAAAPEQKAAALPASAALADDPVMAGGALLVLTTRGSSWVQVVDADGAVQLRKTLADGETARVNGVLPLSVVLGRANEIDVLVRGKPFDLAPLSKDNVARFQIK